MKITFISNFMNHHQLPFSMAMYNRNDIEYHFIATEKIPQERIKLGYEDMNSKYQFIIEAYKDEENEKKAQKIADESDIVIIGSAPEKYIKKRLKENKLTFRYSERMFKNGIKHIYNPKIFAYMFLRGTIYKNKNLYLLCASAYTAFDFSLVGAYKDKCYKWGYFPETKKYNIQELMNKKEKNDPIKLVWVARFIDWKHPELVVELANKLKEDNYNFKIEMIGCGELEKNIKKMIDNNNLSKYISLTGAIEAKKVREHMENANIFLATSDQNEGWGAVVNEAMNSACVVIGNEKIGSIPYLINTGENGLVYSNKKDFFSKVEKIINNKEEIRRIGINAYHTIERTWNAENAANNFILLCNGLMNGKEILIENGPCSKDKKEYKK